MFSSLQVRNYRLFFTGQLISNVGTWMQRIAQDWLVFTLSGNDPIALGIAVALQFTPTLLLSLWAGVIADRVDKRRLMVVLQSIMGIQALVLGLLTVTGAPALSTTKITPPNDATPTPTPAAAAPGKFVPNEDPAHEAGESAAREAQENAGQRPTVP